MTSAHHSPARLSASGGQRSARACNDAGIVIGVTSWGRSASVFLSLVGGIIPTKHLSSAIQGKYEAFDVGVNRGSIAGVDWLLMKRRTKNEPRLAVPSCHGRRANC